MHIIGTAGHVDHGKSALVIALTGHNPDRWLEERERGMTLDLGFAPLRFDGTVAAGIVDVPGHERFLHNMLAGAAGMELLLLVVAATEGPKPQTYEHLRILDFLNVRRAIVVLTKADLVDATGLSLAAGEAREACRGTLAAGAPLLAVSSTTGAGIAELKSAIRAALAQLPPRPADAPAFLPVDRVFALAGRGTIVTGTLMQGTIRTGDALALQPSGIGVRVRSLQVFGQNVDSASGGSRVAVNLPGVAVDAIGRGETLAAPREFVPAADLIVDFLPLSGALPALRRRSHVRAHIGSAEIPGLLIFERAPRDVGAVRARLALSRPVVFYPGSRFVVRGMSPKALLGGGSIASAHGRRSAAVRPKVDDGPTVGRAELAARSADGRTAALLAALEGAGLDPQSTAKLAATANVTVGVAQAEISALLASGAAVALTKPAEYLARRWFDDAFSTVRGTLRERHESQPWRAGCTAAELARALDVDAALTGRLLLAWQDDGRVARLGPYWRLPDFKPALAPQQRSFLTALLRDNAAQPLVPRSFDESASAVAASDVAGVADAFETLQLTGALVRIGDDLYLRGQIEQATSVLFDLLKRAGGATLADVRNAFGTSRKYALPLMEYFDGIGLTIRDGNIRRLRTGARDKGPRADSE
mgnify:CR=1 FL=1